MPETSYIEDVRQGRVRRDDALWQLGDEFRSILMSFDRISGVYDALGERKAAKKVGDVIVAFQELFSIEGDGSFVARI